MDLLSNKSFSQCSRRGKPFFLLNYFLCFAIFFFLRLFSLSADNLNSGPAGLDRRGVPVPSPHFFKSRDGEFVGKFSGKASAETRVLMQIFVFSLLRFIFRFFFCVRKDFYEFLTSVTSPAAMVTPPTRSITRPISFRSEYLSMAMGRWKVSSTKAHELLPSTRGFFLTISPVPL